MARISRNSFSRGKNRVKVVEQIGIPVVDSEFNEAQDILRVQSAENAMAAMCSLRATTSGRIATGFTVGEEWQPYSTGTNTIFIKKGALFFDGFQLVLDADLDLASVGVVFGDTGVTYKVGLIYVDVVFGEKDSTTDASIAIPNVGEASVRQVCSMTWNKVEITQVDPNNDTWEDAFAAAAALPIVADAAVWKGNTARIFIAKYERVGAIIEAGRSYGMSQSTTGDYNQKQTFPKFLKGGSAATATDDAYNAGEDGITYWDVTSSRLHIGTMLSGGSSYAGGLQLRKAGHRRHVIANRAAAGWDRGTGTTVNGSSIAYDITAGWVIPDGSALGYIAPQPTAVANCMETKIGDTNLITDNVRSIGGTVGNATSRPLVVLSLATFGDNPSPSTFIICYRQGNDLIWWNGRVTRGNASQPVFDDPTLALNSDYTFIASQSGHGHGSQSYALEAGMSLLASGGGSGALGLSRHLKTLGKRGSWALARRVHKYGTAAEAASMLAQYSSSNNRIELEGDGPGHSLLDMWAVYSTGRVNGDIADVELRAHRIVLRNMTFKYSTTVNQSPDATHRHAYLMYLQGAEVILENCHFEGGGLYINANHVTLKGCTFTGGNWTGWDHWGTAGSNFVAQQLFLEGTTLPYTVTRGSKWLIEDCQFEVGRDQGTHASVVVKPWASGYQQTRVAFRGCKWRYIHVDAKIPSLDIRNTVGEILVDNCTFAEARGVPKAGTTTSYSSNSYAGSLNSLAIGTSYNTAAYIAATYGRAATSKLVVRECSFSMGSIGDGASAAKYVLWAAMAVLSNGNHTANPAVYNVKFIDNYVQMFVDNTGASAGWGASTASSLQPVIYGFICGLDTPHTGLVASHLIEHIEVSGNRFDLGGHTTGPFAWRSIISRMDQAGNWVDHTSCAVGIILSAQAVTGVAAANGRSIKVNRNVISQRAVASTGANPAYQTSLATLSGQAPPADTKLWVFVPIMLCSGMTYMAVSNGVTSADALSGGKIASFEICDNQIVHVAFLGDINSGVYSNIFFNARQGLIARNQLVLPNSVTTVHNLDGVDSNQVLVAENYGQGVVFFYLNTSGTCYASGNRMAATAAFFSGAGTVDNLYDGGASGDNW